MDELVGLMARGEFLGGPTVDQLVNRWGQARPTVYEIVSEAYRAIRRIVRYDQTDDGIRAVLVTRAAMLGEEARKRVKVVRERVRNKAGELHFVPFTDPDPDFPSAMKAIEIQAKLLGLLHQSVEHSGPDGGPIPIAAAAVVVLPAQRDDGDPQAAARDVVDVAPVGLLQGKGNGRSGEPGGGNGKGGRGGNGRGGNGRG